MRLIVLLALSVLTASPALAQYISCPSWNRYITDPLPAVAGTQEHATGNHQASATFNSSCEYTEQANTQTCAISCQTTTTGDAFDTGSIAGGLKWHDAAFDITQGDATSNGAQVQCGGQVQAAVRSCIVLTNCDETVNINGSVAGIGGSVSYSNSPIWKATTLTYSNTCSTRGWAEINTRPVFSQPGCDFPTEVAPGNMLDYGYLYIWDNGGCDWEEAEDSCLSDGVGCVA